MNSLQDKLIFVPKIKTISRGDKPNKAGTAGCPRKNVSSTLKNYPKVITFNVFLNVNLKNM